MLLTEAFWRVLVSRGRERGELSAIDGAAIGGSLGLCIVRAYFAGGGASKDVYKLCPWSEALAGEAG